MVRARKHKPQSSKARKTPAWRAFEQLVARIEQAAGPRGVKLQSPERVKDFVTGRRREVDVTLRSAIGTSEILVTIECRKRSPKQDVTWIEQLATKRRNIRAARTIAVSPVGFSASAVVVAAVEGIDLRKLEEVTKGDIDSWLAPSHVIHVFRQSAHKQVGVSFRQQPGDPAAPTLAPEVAAQRAAHGVNAKIFTHLPSGTILGVNDIWLHAQSMQDFYGSVPADGTKVTHQVTINVEKGLLSVPTTDGVREVCQIRLGLELWHAVEEVPLTAGSFTKYSSPEGVPVQRAEFQTQLQNLSIFMSLQSLSGSREVAFELAVSQHGPLQTP